MTEDRDQSFLASQHPSDRATPLAPPRSSRPVVIFERLAPDVELPRRATARAVGYDLKAYLLGSKVKFVCGTAKRGGADVVTERGPDPEADVPHVRLFPGIRAIVPTGLKVAMPEGYEMQIRPCAETSVMKGLTLMGASGTYGPDDREEIAIFLRNTTSVAVTIEHGARLARAVFVPVAQLSVLEGLMHPAAPGEE